MATDYTLLSTIVSNQLTVPGDGVVDRGGITFIGRGTEDYDQIVNTSLLKLVENFASEEDPGNPGFPLVSVIDNPVVGQKWFNITANSLLVYDGTSWVSSIEDNFIEDQTVSVDNTTNDVSLDMFIGGSSVTDAITLTNIATSVNLTDHFTGSNAHSSSAIVLSSGTVSGANVQAGVLTLDTLLDDHIADTTAHSASAISFSPFSAITSTNVQDAIEELEGQLNSSQSNLTSSQNTLNSHVVAGGHQASAIFHDPIAPGPNTDVQAAIDDLDAALAAAAGSKILDWTKVTNDAPGTYVPMPTQSVPAFIVVPVTFKQGDTFNQFNLSNLTYTAAFNQEVEIRAFCDIDLGSRIEIRVNGTAIAQNVASPVYDAGPPSNVFEQAESAEVVTKTLLAAGDQVRVLYAPLVVNERTRVGPDQLAIEFIVFRELGFTPSLHGPQPPSPPAVPIQASSGLYSPGVPTGPTPSANPSYIPSPPSPSPSPSPAPPGGGGGGGGGGCFVLGSTIQLADGTVKAIEDVRIGEFVIGQNGIISQVINFNIRPRMNRNIYAINDDNYFVTDTHPILTRTGWRAFNPVEATKIHPELNIKQLGVGDYLIKYDPEDGYYHQRIDLIKASLRNVAVYSLNVSGSDTPEIPGNDTYVVNGIVVHNK